MTDDDAVGDREPQAGPLTHLLGGEERLEYPLHSRLVDSVPGVADGELHERALFETRIHLGERFVRFESAKTYRENAARFTHGVLRVHTQVKQYLVDLCGVS